MVETATDWLAATPVTLYDAIGLTGVALYLIAYGGVQIGRVNGNGPSYAALNGAAAGCVLVSMAGAFNLAGALVNALFLTFSAVGLTRYGCARLRERALRRRAEMQAMLAAPVEAERAVAPPSAADQGGARRFPNRLPGLPLRRRGVQ